MAAVPSIGRAARVEGGSAPEADLTRALYEQYANQIFRYCLHQLGSREEAEDAVQSTFLNAFRGIKRGVVPELESAWLFKIAHNVCLSRRRTTWRRGRIESPTDFDVVEELAPAPSRRSDELIGLQDALEQLPENQRRAILLREWQGLSYREIAEELELSQAAVETLIFRARRALASGLEKPAETKRRIVRGTDLGNVLAGLKSLLLGGGAAVKVAATVAVVSASTVVAAAPVVQYRAHVHSTPKPTTPAPASPGTQSAPSTVPSSVAGPASAFPAKGVGARTQVRRDVRVFGSLARGQGSHPSTSAGSIVGAPPDPTAPTSSVAEQPPAAAAPVYEPAPAAPAAPAADTQHAPAVTTSQPDKTAASGQSGGDAKTQSGGDAKTQSGGDAKTQSGGDAKKDTTPSQTSPAGTGSTTSAGSSDSSSSSGSKSDSEQRTSSSSSTSSGSISSGSTSSGGATTTAPVVSAPTTSTTPVVQTGKTTTPTLQVPAVIPMSPKTASQYGSSQSSGSDSSSSQSGQSSGSSGSPVVTAPTPAPAPAAPSAKPSSPTPVVAAPTTTTQPAPVVSSPAISLSSGSTSTGKLKDTPAKGGGNS